MNDSVRRDFPVVQEFNHLNSAMISPLPTPVMEAVRGYFDGRQAIPTIKPWLAKADEVRHQVATLIGARFEEIGFAMSTADGINLVASAIDWRAGDNVVLDDLAGDRQTQAGALCLGGEEGVEGASGGVAIHARAVVLHS